jgi:hypothetical protein
MGDGSGIICVCVCDSSGDVQSRFCLWRIARHLGVKMENQLLLAPSTSDGSYVNDRPIIGKFAENISQGMLPLQKALEQKEYPGCTTAPPHGRAWHLGTRRVLNRQNK